MPNMPTKYDAMHGNMLGVDAPVPVWFAVHQLFADRSWICATPLAPQTRMLELPELIWLVVVRA